MVGLSIKLLPRCLVKDFCGRVDRRLKAEIPVETILIVLAPIKEVTLALLRIADKGIAPEEFFECASPTLLHARHDNLGVAAMETGQRILLGDIGRLFQDKGLRREESGDFK